MVDPTLANHQPAVQLSLNRTMIALTFPGRKPCWRFGSVLLAGVASVGWLSDHPIQPHQPGRPIRGENMTFYIVRLLNQDTEKQFTSPDAI